jgi:hypothetical protein
MAYSSIFRKIEIDLSAGTAQAEMSQSPLFLFSFKDTDSPRIM